MTLLEPKFVLTKDSSPYGSTTKIETYLLKDGEQALCYRKETESLMSMRERLDDDQTLMEADLEPELEEHRFEADPGRVNAYHEYFRTLSDEVGAPMDQDSRTVYRADVFHETGEEEQIIRWDSQEAPLMVKQIFSELERLAFENTL
ncbi:MAG: hypothetical protein ABEJ64_02375 [Candidatus Nanohaloarchaea archaeon]